MALKKIVPEKNGYRGRVISMGSDGAFLISKELSDEVRNIPNVGIDFYEDGGELYVGFSVNGTIPIRLKSDETTYFFHSVEFRKRILKSAGIDYLVHKKRFRVLVGKMIVKDGIEVYALITESLKSQLS